MVNALIVFCCRVLLMMMHTGGLLNWHELEVLASWRHQHALENRFFQISFYSRAYVRIVYKKTKGQIPLGPFLGKQNIQAKEVYSSYVIISQKYTLYDQM